MLVLVYRRGVWFPDMTTRSLGLIVGASDIVVVDAEYQKGRYIVIADETWDLAEGDRGAAYAAIHSRLVDYIIRLGIDRVTLKASAIGPSKATLSHLHGAELRGVIHAAAASTTAEVSARSQAAVGKKLGKRKIEEYLSDEDFWKEQPITGKLRKGSRLAMLFLMDP